MTKYFFKVVIPDDFNINEKIIMDSILKCIKLKNEAVSGTVEVKDITNFLEEALR